MADPPRVADPAAALANPGSKTTATITATGGETEDNTEHNTEDNTEDLEDPGRDGMAAKWAAMSKGARILLAAVLLYVVESILIVATDADANNGYASVLIGAVTSVFGAFLAAAALRTDYLSALRLRWRLRSGAERATATVAAMVSFHNSDFTYPVFEYTTPDGVTHRHADASSRALEVGATTEVRYLPDEADFAVGPMSRFNIVVFAVLAALGTVLLMMMPLMTVQALFS